MPRRAPDAVAPSGRRPEPHCRRTRDIRRSDVDRRPTGSGAANIGPQPGRPDDGDPGSGVVTARLDLDLPAPGAYRTLGRTADRLPADPDPLARLSLAEANALLTDGGYGLVLQRERGGRPKLCGPGTGSGIDLGEQPAWVDLYRVLVLLRHTRSVRNAAWLHRLSGALGAETACADENSEHSTDAVRLPGERLRLLTAGHRELADRCFEQLLGAENSVQFPDSGPGTAVSRAERAVALQPVDIGRDPLGRVHAWEHLAEAVGGDPVLRMYCATQPVPGALVDTWTGVAATARIAQPVPEHPRHPGGTIAVPPSALLNPGEDGAPALLRVVVCNRFERREDALGYFLEHFVRPLLRSFRLALDAHRIGLLGLDERGVGFELSPELQPTGRVVVTDTSRVNAEPAPADVPGGAHRLMRTLQHLQDGFCRMTEEPEQVPGAVRGVIGEELRYLEPRTLELLSGAGPLRDYAHAVSGSQDQVLKGVLNRVQDRTRKRRWDPDLHQPAVLVDLDMCGVVPVQRIQEAVRAVSGPRPGAEDGVVELASPAGLPVLPNHTASTWANFLQSSGLARRYPSVDWDQVRTDFRRAFHARGREHLRGDAVNAGLARFVWDVRDGGGLVVFSTRLRERHRQHLADLLRSAGVPDCPLLCQPDGAAAPVTELLADELREHGGLEVVAVFDDELANRLAITKDHPDALPVAVEAPGIAAERHPDHPVTDTDAVITTFETTPRPGPAGGVGTRLSNTHSLEELQVGALRRNRLAQRWSVELGEQESLAIVDRMVADADRAAVRTARSAIAKFGVRDVVDEQDRVERVLRAVHHVLTRKQFVKGSRANYPFEQLYADAAPFVRDRTPIDVVLFGFPVKQCLNRLKASGPLPDMAELGGLVRLRELHRAVAAIYPPGLHFNVLTDGRHFRSRSVAITGAYRRKLLDYADLVGIRRCTTIEDIDVVAAQRLGPGLPAERAARIERYRARLTEQLRRFDITDNPLRTLDEVHRCTGEFTEFHPNVIGLFREMLMSLVYSVPVAVPGGVERLAWSTAVYADIYNVTDASASDRVRRARAAVLRRAWHTVIRYLCTLQVDEEFGYERMFPNRVRLTVTAARHGCLGFTYLGGSGLLPWQGTGAVDARGHVGVDFAISLLDRGFVPVYSALLGPRQPWFMAPAQQTHLTAPESGPVPAPRGQRAGLRLDDQLLGRVRLRRR